MPKTLPWMVVHREKSQVELNMFITMSKSMRFHKNNTTTCTICASGCDSHSMAYQLASCSSKTCRELAFNVKCGWRAKVVQCKNTGLVSVYELGAHLTLLQSPRANQLTRPLRFLVKSMVDRDLKPARIRDDLIETLNLDASSIPRLVDVQNCVANYRRSHKSNSDLLETLNELATKYSPANATADEDTIAFGFDLDDFGGPVLGEGTDEDPFIFGLTTRTLVRLLDADPERFILHIDATFKLNQSSFPVFVIGTSGVDRSFHPVAFFIVSQRTEAIIVRILQSLSAVFLSTTSRHICVKYVMGDADHAQRNAVHAVLGRDANVCYIMCFYHVIAKVAERTKGMNRTMRKEVFQHIYDMHYARSQEELEKCLELAWEVWAATAETVKFGQYFYGQWLRGKFMRWQCYHSPSGFAKTNNPVEQFNKLIKRDYTLRVRVKVGALIEKFAACCRKHSKVRDAPKVSRESKKMKRRMLLMSKCTKIRASAGLLMSSILNGPSSADELCVISCEYVSKEEYNQLTKSEKVKLQGTMSMSNARMEFRGMPPSGWKVNLRWLWCPCSYWYQFACCVHVLFALSHMGRVMPWEKEQAKRLKNRSVNKRTRSDSQDDDAPRPGRPPRVGFALSFE